ncbi:MAG: gamma carbonic anhydrase family protein [Spirochaetia bacterium]|jgi:carbonic anhydrase/acetyltransferase-like protein (isoleucine patch superfamily)|nr:gamma carbonic anhydrase family protein [Spirochaetia bacterium]
MIHKFNGMTPNIEKSNFVAASAEIIGDVSSEEGSSIWYNSTLRGDIAPITIGKNSNVQDNSVIHVGHDVPTIIGDNVTIGHRVLLHGCTIEDGCLIGMGAIILDNSVIGKESIVGAGALVTMGKKFPPRSLILGSPAKVIRSLTDEEVEGSKKNTESYVKISMEY